MVLKQVNLRTAPSGLTAIVGESGCGKSTLASVFMGKNKQFTGSVTIGGVPLASIREEELLKHMTYVGHRSCLFCGTVRDNLRMGCADASDEKLWEVLERVNMKDFLQKESELDTFLAENAAKISGGQRQRLAMARALLHDSRMYIFDEATSNIDVESETTIMREIYALSKSRPVLLISHRLANVVDADQIYVLEHGENAGHGPHETLLAQGGCYAKRWEVQEQLERYAKGGGTDEEAE